MLGKRNKIEQSIIGTLQLASLKCKSGTLMYSQYISDGRDSELLAY